MTTRDIYETITQGALHGLHLFPAGFGVRVTSLADGSALMKQRCQHIPTQIVHARSAPSHSATRNTPGASCQHVFHRRRWRGRYTPPVLAPTRATHVIRHTLPIFRRRSQQTRRGAADAMRVVEYSPVRLAPASAVCVGGHNTRDRLDRWIPDCDTHCSTHCSLTEYTRDSSVDLRSVHLHVRRDEIARHDRAGVRTSRGLARSGRVGFDGRGCFAGHTGFSEIAFGGRGH